MKQIEITFRPDGTSEVKAVGFKGKGCQEITAPFEQALGTVTADRKTPEFYQKADTTLKQKI